MEEGFLRARPSGTDNTPALPTDKRLTPLPPLLLFLPQECYKECCKKCSLGNGAHCSDGPCCNTTCLVRTNPLSALHS